MELQVLVVRLATQTDDETPKVGATGEKRARDRVETAPIFVVQQTYDYYEE
jgi:hypothetical protein